MADDNNKSIMCPNCGKYLTKADKRDSNINKLACKNCHKWIWYTPNDDDNYEIREIPNSISSSGMTFY